MSNYSPKNIETAYFENDYEDKYESKGGYSVAKLLEQRNGIIGGGGNESLMSRIKDLYIPVGLVSRQYARPINKHKDTYTGKCVSEEIINELENLIFKGKSSEKQTKKLENHEEHNYTRKYRKNT
jgi:hypothetical protein